MEASLFGRLPAELRDTIYEAVLKVDHQIHIGAKFFAAYTGNHHASDSARHHDSGDGDDDSSPSTYWLALTMASKTLRRESTRVFCATNEFRFVAGLGDGLDAFKRFLHAIGRSNASALRHCTVDMPSIEFPMSKMSPHGMFEVILHHLRALQYLGQTRLRKCDVAVMVSFIYFHGKRPLALGVGCEDMCASLGALIDHYHSQWQSFQKRPRLHRELAIAVDNLRRLRDQLEQPVSDMPTIQLPYVEVAPSPSE